MKQIIQRMVALVLAAALCLTVMPLAFAVTPADAAITPAQYAQVDALWDEITQLENETMSALSTNSVSAVDIQAVAQLVEDSSLYIADSMVWNGTDAFTFMTTAGVRCKYSLRLRQQVRDAKPADVEATADTQVTSYAVKGGSPSNSNVYVIQPYYGVDSSFTTQYVQEGQSIASTTGGTCTVKQRNAATIDAVADALEDGAVVIFDSHGDTDYAKGDDYVSGATTSYLCLQSGTGITSADYADNNAVYGGSYGSMSYYMVNGTAISNHMEKDNPHGILWMAICLSMATDGLEKPLRERGVEVAYGYSQSVTFDGDYLYEETFWQNMKNGKTVSEAVSAMKAQYGHWDPAYSNYSFNRALREYVAFPVVVSSEDAYPGHGNVDNYQTVNSTWTLMGAPYNITARSSDESMGTVTLTGTTVTASPKEGYYATGATVSPTGAATVTQDGNRFFLSNITADCTVTVNFAAKTPATVTYSVPEGVTQDSTQTYVKDSIILPQPTGVPVADAQEYAFLGWVEHPVEDTTALPTVYAAGSVYTVPSAQTTLYALYTYRVSLTGETGCRLVTEPRTDWSGEYVICGNGTHILSADGTVSGSNIATNGAVTLEAAGLSLDGTLMNGVTGSHLYRIESVGDAYSIRMVEGGLYLSLSTNSNSLTTATTADAKNAQWTISYSNDQVYIYNVSYSSRKLQFNEATEEFRCYSSARAPISLYGSPEMVSHYTTNPQNQQHIHTYTAVVTPPTCTQPGYTTYTCACSDSYIGDETAALGHDFGAWQLTQAPTAHEAGEEARVCNRCGETETRVVTATGCPSAKFTDVNPDLWYHQAIDFVVSNGLFAGITDTTFAPNSATTRAMLVTVLWRLDGRPEAKTVSGFTDVKSGQWYTTAVNWAAENGIVAGITNTTFCPGALITREQVAAIFYRYAAYQGYDTAADGDLSGFTDAQKISPYAQTAMQWAVGKGILNGMGNGQLAPKGNTTRAEMAQMLMKFVQFAG